MSSEPIRDPVADRLLTPQNAMMIIIDYQPTPRPAGSRIAWRHGRRS